MEEIEEEGTLAATASRKGKRSWVAGWQAGDLRAQEGYI